MAGGSGTRLWPLSRSSHPKQFLSLMGTFTMMQDTINRLSKLDIEKFVTVGNEEHRFFIAEQLREINIQSDIILEPFGRDTAASIALAAFNSKSDSLLLVLPADHHIEDEDKFIETIDKAKSHAWEGKLITFGIEPTNAHTGYGYIEVGDPLGSGFDVKNFIEKPDKENAEILFNSQEYLWKSGIFLFRASSYLRELEKYNPDLFESCKKSMEHAVKDIDFLRIDKVSFELCPKISIDHAVMEKTNKAMVFPLNVAWRDIGSWSALWELNMKDDAGNFTEGDVILEKVQNSFIRTDNQLVAAVGVENMIIVSTKDALLVVDKNNVEDVKIITQNLELNQRSEREINREVYRPWGKYDTVDIGERYKVKRITVNPNGKLSLQLHRHRAEHWVVVSGIAKVTKGKETFILSENESTYISIGEVHSLENPGKSYLELIEVQSGSYLAEDDILRLSDVYNRV